MNQKSDSPLHTMLLFAAGTLLAAAATTLVLRLLQDKNMEHLARLAAGESDFQHGHPKRRN